MRKDFFFSVTLAAVCVFIGCKKDSNTAQSGSMLGGYKDSMNQLSTTYAGGKINALSFSGRVAWNFEYKKNYVKASRPDLYVEYFLNDLDLPIKISKTYQGSKIEIVFHYKTGTNRLDSVVSTNSFIWGRKESYTFTYNGENITQLIQRIFYNDGTISEGSTYYTYYSAPNVFRRTDPLLYIYVNPAADLSYNNMLFYFPKVFSLSTFRTYTLGQITAKEGMLHYELNDKGRIVKEWYDQYGYQYDYFYN